MEDKKLKILVVDDEDSLRISLASILELEGFDVKMAASGFEAVDIAKNENFDILFSDIRMQGMTGNESFKIIKKLHPNIVGVMMTAYALNDLIVDAMDNGAFASLPDGLKEIASVRLENPYVSLEELGKLLDQPIGKSGVNHRLRKLSEAAEKLRKGDS